MIPRMETQEILLIQVILREEGEGYALYIVPVFMNIKGKISENLNFSLLSHRT